MNDRNDATGPGIHAGVQITAIVGGYSNRETRVPDSIAPPGTLSTPRTTHRRGSSRDPDRPGRRVSNGP